MLLKTGEERERRMIEETDGAEVAGLMEISGKEEREWEFKLSVKINAEFYDISQGDSIP